MNYFLIISIVANLLLIGLVFLYKKKALSLIFGISNILTTANNVFHRMRTESNDIEDYQKMLLTLSPNEIKKTVKDVQMVMGTAKWIARDLAKLKKKGKIKL